jgi:hypothetical protein
MVKNKQGGSPEGCGGYAGVVKVGKLNVDRQKNLGMPTLEMFIVQDCLNWISKKTEFRH